MEVGVGKTGNADKKVKGNPVEKSKKESEEKGSRGKRETNRKGDCCRACVYKEGKIFGCG
jgi:hypothetical protein